MIQANMTVEQERDFFLSNVLVAVFHASTMDWNWSFKRIQLHNEKKNMYINVAHMIHVLFNSLENLAHESY